jgi:hypothetical protein
MEWISVKDRLPEQNKYVLTYNFNTTWSLNGNGSKCQILAYVEIDDGIYVFLSECGTSYDITHWMPLPPFPKE